jgi:ADP-heptose:LPS heptosyltransferase
MGWPAATIDDLDLGGLTALGTHCRAWIGPDSGPSHLVAAVGARVGVVFVGATDPKQWAPPGAKVFGPAASATEISSWVLEQLC